jgi:hypothetical protein
MTEVEISEFDESEPNLEAVLDAYRLIKAR